MCKSKVDLELSLFDRLVVPYHLQRKQIVISDLNYLIKCSFYVFVIPLFWQMINLKLILMFFIFIFLIINSLLFFEILNLYVFKLIFIFYNLSSFGTSLQGYLEFLIFVIVSLLYFKIIFYYLFYHYGFHILLSFMSISYF